MEKYYWNNIAKSKTDIELEAMFKNEFFLDLEARYYALVELKSRNKNPEKNSFLQKQLLSDCYEKLDNLSKPKLRETLIIINPYIAFALCFFFLIGILFNLKNTSFNDPSVVFAIFFGVGGILNFLISRLRIRNINRTKTKEKEKIQSFINLLEK